MAVGLTVVLGTLLLASIGEATDHGYFKPYQFVQVQNAVSLTLYEAVGVHEINKFTSGGLYHATIYENVAIGSYAKSTIKMGLYVQTDEQEQIKYAVVGSDDTRLTPTKCSGMNTFDIRGRLVENFYSLSFITKRILNEEACRSYLFTIKALYAKSKRTIDTTDVLIHVRVASHLPPRFSTADRAVQISSDFPLFQPILRLNTTDKADIGNVYFTLTSKSVYFELDPVNGVLFLKRHLPWTSARHALSAQVKKWDSKQIRKAGQLLDLDNTCQITVKVTVVNQYPPSISVEEIRPWNKNKSRTLVATIKVSDLDNGKNGQIASLVISSQEMREQFYLEKVNKNNTVYHLRLLKPLETTRMKATVDFLATDNGEPAKSTGIVQQFTFESTLNFKPYFTQSDYFINVSEITPLNVTIFRVSVNNLQASSVFFYSIVGGVEGNKFRIRSATGELYVSGELDAETTTDYTLKIALNVIGIKHRVISTNIHVHVEDFNDNAPKFTSDSYYIEIQEDLALNTDIYKIQATDKDQGENGLVSYWLLNTDQFSIDPDSGVISVKHVSDRDTGSSEYVYLVVRAGDRGTPMRRETETLVKIRIKEWNDNHPVIKQDQCTLRLSPTSPVGSKVVQIEALDIDLKQMHKPSFHFVMGNSDKYFALDKTTGEVTVAKPLENTQSSFRLVISATDGTYSSVNNAVLQITLDGGNKENQVLCKDSNVYTKALKVLNNRKPSTSIEPIVNDKLPKNTNTPRFADKQLLLTISEDVLNGSVLAKVKAIDNDRGFAGLLRYYIMSGNLGQIFHLDAETGELKTIRNFDREKQSKYQLNISAWDTGVPRKVGFMQMIIIIKDVNDNPPIFLNKTYKVSVSENAREGTKLLRVFAADKDSDADITYYLINDHNKLFMVHYKKGDFILNKRLDFETNRFYQVKVLAVDSSMGKKLVGKADILVKVLDSNDNHPVANPSTQNIFLMKDFPKNKPISLITAVDPDTGLGGKLKFTLVKGYGYDYFSINPESGLLSLRRSLLRSGDTDYNLTVTISDGGTPVLSSEAYIKIHILQRISNRNNEIISAHGDGIFTYVVSENLPKGEVVAQLTKISSNQDLPNSFLFSIIDGTDVTAFNLHGTAGILTTTSTLDHEKAPFYWLTVHVVGKQSGQFHKNIQILIKVQDENDNSPIFYPPVYESKIPENLGPGELVVEVSAEDLDSGANGEVTYSISGGNHVGHFKIDSTTGVITTTTTPIDHEEKERIQLVVTAKDNGNPSQSSQTTVTVLIQDENDNKPVFQDNQDIDLLCKTAIPEGVVLGQILATDKDSGENGQVTFKVLNGNDDKKLRIDSKSGQLFSEKILTTDDYFQLLVEARDGGNKPLSTTKTIYVTIAPMSGMETAVNPLSYTNKVVDIYRDEDAHIGHIINIKSATNKYNDILVYSIMSGNEDGVFKLNAFGTSLQTITKMKPTTYHIVIRATNGLHSCNFTLNIMVKGVNDHYPRPKMIEKIATVQENAPKGTEVVRVTGTDLDSGNNAEIVYSFKSALDQRSLDCFAIDAKSGQITVAGTVDYEEIRSHVIIVALTDQGGIPKESTMYVIINVHDVNEWKPNFIQPSYAVAIQELLPRGSDVVKIQAQDRDQGSDGIIKYSISSGNEGFAFSIQPQTGIIQTNRILRESDISRYSLVVEARDDGSEGLTAAVNVTVTLLTRGDRPGFSEDTLFIKVTENEPIDSFVTSVGFDGMMTFYNMTKETGCSGHFKINCFTGVITTKAPLDAEDVSSCSLTIKAEDADGYTQRMNVDVSVGDLNDNPPTIPKQYVGHVKENSPAGTKILRANGKPLVIVAKDNDVDLKNREIIYEIISPPDMKSFFEREQLTGNLVTSKALDYEERKSYTMLLKASNVAHPSLYALTTITVNVINVNDVAPKFIKTIFDVTLYLPTYKGVHVISLEASHADVPGELSYSVDRQDSTSLLDVDTKTGEITIGDPSDAREGLYNAVVGVAVGNLMRRAKLRVLFKKTPLSSLQFTKPFYQSHVMENTSTVQTVIEPFVKGYNVGQRITFHLLNHRDVFSIKQSTGVVETQDGAILDREEISVYKLVIMVQDDSVPPCVAQTAAIVIVDDANDCSPRFPPPPIFFVVPKSSATNSVVATMNATDCDEGENGEVRYRIKVDRSGKFAIDSHSGKLTITESIDDLPTPAEFSLVIEARDSGSFPLSTEADVSVRIESGDACIFEKPSYFIKVPENTTIHRNIKTLHARCPNGKPVFSIMSGDNFNEMEIDVNNGDLSLSSQLDFERKQKYELSVRAKDSKTGASSQTTVHIFVQDVNDNAPTFVGAPFFARIRENSRADATLLRVAATDLDSGVNRQHSFEIVGGSAIVSETFSIHNASGVLRLKRPLDYEASRSYHVPVRVYDHGDPSLSSETLVKVFVRDVNDNAPKFQRSHYSVTVLENAGPSHFVTQILATDLDESDFLNLRYRITSGVGNEFFRIDSKSGVISLSKTPGLVLGKVYTITCAVTDGNFTADATVDIVVGQVNNHKPNFAKKLLHARVTENYPADSYVAMVTATDHDVGDFGDVTYTLDSVKANEDFKIDRVSGIVTTIRPLDREQMSAITIPVRAADKGGKSDFCDIQVDILDENDNQPQFLMPAYTAIVSVSRATIGNSVLTVTAVDPDDGENGALTYSLVGQTSPFVFHINSTSGQITFLKKPRESTYNFYVRVSDNGFIKLKNYAQVRVVVDALVFQFEQNEYSLSLSENSVGVVDDILSLVYDNGSRVLDAVSYSIETGASPRTNNLGTFNISRSGRIQIARTVDYEQVQRYDLTIKANSSSFTTFTVVRIHVQDENDNRPIFESDVYNVNVSENAQPGAKILQVRARDKDSGQNGLVTYAISQESRTMADIFSVDENSGWLTTKVMLNRESVPAYNLTVVAKDNGKTNSFMSKTQVRITVTDINDSPPVFSRPIYRKSISEDSPVGSEILTLTTTDADAHSSVVYYIVKGDRQNRFNIDQRTGKLYVNAELDRELYPRYLLNVTASDGAYVASALVNIEILDVNDNKPVCLQPMSRVRVLENVTVGTHVAAVNVTDKDTANKSRITYAISTHCEKFSVDKVTGLIKVNGDLDRETKESHNFLVSASDGNDACYTNVTVELVDVNDNPPIFTKSRYTKPVPLDSELNAVLLKVEATDADVGANRKVSYTFTSSSTSDVFFIEKQTGIISLKKRFLKRDEEKFVFGVTASDGGVPSLSSNATVEIVVSTISDCPFTKSEYKKEIREDTAPDFEIDTVSVTCVDKFSDIFFIYKIADGDGEAMRLFRINKNTGKLYLNARLDYESARTHSFTVVSFMVKPSGKAVSVSSAPVKINVLDYNDNEPVFEKDSYVASVSEGEYSKEGSNPRPFVIQVYASDKDVSDVVEYSIVKSTPEDGKFEISSSSGTITVADRLDREETDRYELVVRARDNGIPSQSSTVPVVITIKDINDNAPVVEKEIHKLVRTDVLVGSTVLQLTATDADGPANAKPFTYTMLSGENDVFKLNTSSGSLTIQKPRRLHNVTFSMVVRTTDAGSPPLYSDANVNLTVVKYSPTPPIVRPLTVHLNMFANKFNGGIIGKVGAYDPDKDSILQFSLVKGDPRFSVAPFDGTISLNSKIDARTYRLEIQIDDGTHTVFTHVTVKAKVITSQVAQNSVTIRISDRTLSSFVSSSLSSMINTLADMTSCNPDHIFLWSIQTAPEKKLDVVFAIWKSDEKGFEEPRLLRENLEEQLNAFEKLSNVVVDSVGIFPCDDHDACQAGKVCYNRIKMLDQWSILASNSVTFLSYKNEQYSECGCPEGVSDCAIRSQCEANPCNPGFECVEHSLSGYECICPKGKNCGDECHGNKCHTSAITFNGQSYTRYSLTDPDVKLASFSASVRTTKASGTIFAVRGKYDYFTLEVMEGKLRVRFDYGSGEGMGQIDQAKVNDGKWHDIKVTRRERNVRVTLNPGGYLVETVSRGAMRFLNVNMSAIVLGGELPQRARRSAGGVSNSYLGCLEKPRVNGNDLPLSGSNSFATAFPKGVTSNCSINVCHESFCRHGGECSIIEQNGYDIPKCTCRPGFTEYDCSKDVDECETSPCENSGLCVNTLGSFTCTCVDEKFKGALCNQPVGQPQPFGKREFFYIGASAMVFLTLIILIVVVCRCYHKQKRKAKENADERHELSAKMKESSEGDRSLTPPPPPPRRGDVEDPPTRLGSRAPSWDYADLPEMVPGKRKHLDGDGFAKKGYDDIGEYSGSSKIPEVPRRPRHVSDSVSIPDVPEKPMQYRLSSSQSSVYSMKDDVPEFSEKELEIIRQGTKDIEKLTDGDIIILDKKRASLESECDAKSVCSDRDEEEPILATGHLETYDHNEVDYFIPEADQDNASDDETSAMLNKIPDVKISNGDTLHKESHL